MNIMDDWDDDALPWSPPIPFEGEEWFYDNCQPFSCPGRIAGQLARKREKEKAREKTSR